MHTMHLPQQDEGTAAVVATCDAHEQGRVPRPILEGLGAPELRPVLVDEGLDDIRLGRIQEAIKGLITEKDAKDSLSIANRPVTSIAAHRLDPLTPQAREDEQKHNAAHGERQAPENALHEG